MKLSFLFASLLCLGLLSFEENRAKRVRLFPYILRMASLVLANGITLA